MAKLLYNIVSPPDLDNVSDNLWSGLEVSEPLVNTFIISTEQGEHFIVNIKKLGK